MGVHRLLQLFQCKNKYEQYPALKGASAFAQKQAICHPILGGILWTVLAWTFIVWTGSSGKGERLLTRLSLGAINDLWFCIPLATSLRPDSWLATAKADNHIMYLAHAPVRKHSRGQYYQDSEGDGTTSLSYSMLGIFASYASWALDGGTEQNTLLQAAMLMSIVICSCNE